MNCIRWPLALLRIRSSLLRISIRMSRGDLFGRVGIIWASRRRIICPVVLIRGLLIWRGLRRTAFIFINRTGGLSCRWRIFYRTGIGRIGVGLVTPVHVFTTGDEAELFLNGQSLGKKKKGQYEYRIRWDAVKYSPGELRVVAYKNGRKWAEDVVRTTGEAYKLEMVVDGAAGRSASGVVGRSAAVLQADGKDLLFVTVKVMDKNGLMVPYAKNMLTFSVEGMGEIVATDNGDAANMLSFGSLLRPAFNGLCLVIVRGKVGQPGEIRLKVSSPGLKDGVILLKSYGAPMHK